MKTITLLLLLTAAAFSASAQARLRVNNNIGVTGTGIFTTAQAAHDAAAAGDIIYLEPSVQTYGNLTCTKRLTIIGNGYLLSDNPGLQLDARSSTLGLVVFVAGSAGSRITGCLTTSSIDINTNNIVVERNYVGARMHIGRNPNTGTVSGPITQVLVRQNFMTGDIYFLVDAASPVSNAVLTNNIIRSGIVGGTATTPMSALIKNNVLGATASNVGLFRVDVANSIFSNNIMTGPSTITGGNNNNFNNNISDNAAFGTADGNQANVPPANIFVGAAAPSADGAYQLRPGPNPARGTGEGGADIGVFGGNAPYRLSGIPNVPTVSQYSQTVTGTTLNAIISTRSNN